MSKNIVIGLGAVLLVIIVLAVVSLRPVRQLGVENTSWSSQQNKAPNAEVDKIQVFLFHGTRRCPTCIAIGKYTNEAINESFQQEVSSGKVEFKEINLDLPENKELAQKFKASGSVLFINTIINGQDNIKENTESWRLVSNPANYKIYLKDTLNGLLGK